MLELVYSTANGLDISIDVKFPSDATPEKPAKAILLWFHGGGLLQGSRKGTCPHFDAAPEKHGLCTVSADYRLAPQAKLPDIMKDMSELFKYLRSSEFATAIQNKANTSKIVVSGSSAGGWLALLCGTGVGFKACGLEAPSPPPTAIAAIYPITDLLDPFWTTPQHPVSYMSRVIEKSEVEGFLDEKAPVLAFSNPTGPRSIFYHYMVQEGIEQQLLLNGTNVDPIEFSIAPKIKAGEYNKNIPPTFVIHGTIDDKVPIKQATDVVDLLKEMGEPTVLEYVPVEGADHLFDKDPKVTMDEMYAFIKKVVA